MLLVVGLIAVSDLLPVSGAVLALLGNASLSIRRAVFCASLAISLCVELLVGCIPLALSFSIHDMDLTPPAVDLDGVLVIVGAGANQFTCVTFALRDRAKALPGTMVVVPALA